MNKDLKIAMGSNVLNIRVGIILRKEHEVALEISKIGANAAVPGGRVRINEHSFNAILREIKEEMNLDLDKSKIKRVDTFENFFEYDDTKFHEIFFLYEYDLNEEEYNYIKSIGNNRDNETTFFELVDNSRLEEVNLLPTLLYGIIRNR